MQDNTLADLHGAFADRWRISLLLQLLLRPTTGVHLPQEVIYIHKTGSTCQVLNCSKTEGCHRVLDC